MAESKSAWYWRRLRAMSAGEILGRVKVKLRQRADRKGPPDFSRLPIEVADFPKINAPANFSEEMRTELERDTKDILAGRWNFFGHLPLQVDRPPKWQYDYLVRRDFQTSASAFDLDHRAQPDGADIKIIWEPSRWWQLMRLAQTAYLLRDPIAGITCVDWLKDWEKNNPSYTGFNWASPLETGIRLIQFCWIDAYLTAAGLEQARITELRKTLLPHHFWYTGRYLSFGSSANNHLLGEMAGLAVALARYPALASLRPDMDQLHREFEREVLLQFAPDGGNREQALSYHHFSLELVMQAEAAIASAGFPISEPVKERLRRAALFFAAVKMPVDPWEYGDSDNASLGLNDFRGEPPNGWKLFPDSGYAVFHGKQWRARLDASELGYLATAAHGHLDALHCSLWFENEPVVIDPGTGAYYADKKLRDHLSSWQAHNGPHLSGRTDFPKRHGTFLWGKPHPKPILTLNDNTAIAEIEMHGCMLRRHVRWDGSAWEIIDESKLLTGEADPSSLGDMRVHWHFAPGMKLEKSSETEFVLRTAKGVIRIVLKNWNVTKWGNATGGDDIDFICSPAFRRIETGPILHLQEAVDSLESCSTRFAAE